MSGSEALVVESPLLKVPFETLKRAAKERKSIIDEAQEVSTSALQPQPPGCTKEQHVQSLTQLLSKLQGLKRKLTEVSKAERDEAQRCKVRLEHLKVMGLPAKDQMVEWNKGRMGRLMVDHLLRMGYQDTAGMLSKQEHIEELVDAHIFVDARKVVDALRRHDCSEALAWCSEHRPKLKKIKSKLEFKLRVQEFIELVRQGQRMEAILYARAHLAPWASQYMQELQRAVATLAFTHKTKCQSYQILFHESQWEALIELFHKELFKLNCLTPESLITVHLQSGLSALKTPLSYQEGCSKEDPLHLPTFQKLAEGLAYAKHQQSKLICSVTREMMNETNPPMVLPNGYVYSTKAVQMITAQNGGKMVCPKTGNVYQLDELRRAYIV